MYWTYVIISSTTGKLYIGQTNDLMDRIARHNNNANLATRYRGPWKLIFDKAFQTRKEAVRLENKLKGFKNPHKVKDWIKRNSG